MSDTHDFLLQDTDANILEIAKETHELVAELPETASTFYPSSDMPGGRSINGLQTLESKAHNAILKLTGAWQLPDRFTSNSVRWVNPHSADARLYSDAAAECENCGATITHLSTHNSDVKDNSGTHDTDCALYHKYETLAQVARKREEIIVEGYYYGAQGHRLRKRVAERGGSLSSHVRALSLDLSELREAYQERRANTAAELCKRGYSTREIAGAYDITPRQIQRDIEQATGQPASKVKA